MITFINNLILLNGCLLFFHFHSGNETFLDFVFSPPNKFLNKILVRNPKKSLKKYVNYMELGFGTLCALARVYLGLTNTGAVLTHVQTDACNITPGIEFLLSMKKGFYLFTTFGLKYLILYSSH